MTADIVNLRQERKKRARAQKEATAEANRLKFGRTKAERQQDAAQKDLDRRALDAKQRDRDGDTIDT